MKDVKEMSLEELQKEYATLDAKLKDIESVHESVSNYSAEMEEYLQQKNEQIESYMKKMKKYLSNQLYDLITSEGEGNEATFKRTRVTIFFSDIVGFSEMTDAVEPEALSECLNHYLSEMSSVVKKYDGTLDKFIGDAVMVFFGAPVYKNDEKHATDCVKMALEMMAKLPDINTFWKKKGVSEGVNIRIGINTGYVTVGNFGSDDRTDYTIVGNNVNAASRLESSAQPGTILISQTTRDLIEDEDISFSFKGSIKVKGIHKPIKTFEPVLKKNMEQLENENVFDIDNFLTIHEDGISLSKFSLNYVDDVDNTKEKLKLFKAMLKEVSKKVQKELRSRI